MLALLPTVAWCDELSIPVQLHPLHSRLVSQDGS